jgi:hypothetical protein
MAAPPNSKENPDSKKSSSPIKLLQGFPSATMLIPRQQQRRSHGQEYRYSEEVPGGGEMSGKTGEQPGQEEERSARCYA